MEYNFNEIEKKWQEYWKKNRTYQVKIDKDKPKYYVLDMFPYPSGAGLHVGHPLGYIASDIYSRYKRLKGFNVLHPMGYDAYGLPAEQYAIQTGQHPAITTEQNINRYRRQLDKIGFSFDWEREIRTCDPSYYKWTQWVFLHMFDSYYCYDEQQARPISELVEMFELQGNKDLNIAQTEEITFTAEEWKAKTEKEKQEILMNYRIAYLADTMVNWCPALGTVLANDEVSEGLSVRGGYPVEQRKMRQWSLRVSAYAQRLLDGLDKIDWTESLKETQKNWIGRSEGAELYFQVKNLDIRLNVFTTRADTVFGVTFMVLAPESEYVSQLVIPTRQAEVNTYLNAVKRRTERERIADRKASGVFTGSYALNPINGAEIPIWISDYVLAGYGTGAIMAVPAHDSRDYTFAKHFNLPIIPLIEGADVSEESFDAKEGMMINSGFLNGLSVNEAIRKVKEYIVENNLGKLKVNYRLRDAIFSRQRYWGEPFPIYYKDGMPFAVDVNDLPLQLPEIDKFLPTETGEPPLGRAKNWTYKGYPLELATMPGFAGSSAYYLRYEDPANTQCLVSKESNEYWRNVDLYIGGTEHATGHLIYSRFWNKFLYDYGIVAEDEPFKKLINQGMIQGRSNFVYRIKNSNTFVSYGLKNQYDVTPIHVDVNIVSNDILDLDAFKKWNPEYKTAEFILEDGKYICGWAIEKMSKSMFNVVNPDDIVEKYGADTLRLYEMFLGPLEQSKPWDTNGIDGVSRFLRKFWNLFFHAGELIVSDDQPTVEELKSIHKLIKKIGHDIENFSFNTSVAAFMICVNELTALNCHKRSILSDFIVVLASFAPFVSEELWRRLGNETTVCDARFPDFIEEYLKENMAKYTISFDGRARFVLDFSVEAKKEEIEATVLSHENSQKWLNGKRPKKIIIVPNKIVNIVL
ncbi:MAG: leucine--tRNA ligase [Dysgonamonadaceae bacterium]|jgi:leucyl-tRNA synthetase|nr:leucine--tRNA ligase [Dysgonamonadaceae bacterium]